VSISLELLDRSSRNLVCRSPVAVALSFSGGVAIRNVLLVLWMTSHLAAVGRMAMHELSVAKDSAPSSVGKTRAKSDVLNALFI